MLWFRRSAAIIVFLACVVLQIKAARLEVKHSSEETNEMQMITWKSFYAVAGVVAFANNFGNAFMPHNHNTLNVPAKRLTDILDYSQTTCHPSLAGFSNPTVALQAHDDVCDSKVNLFDEVKKLPSIQQKYRRNDKDNYVQLPASRMTDDENNFSALAKLLLALADRVFYEHLSKEGLDDDVADRRKMEIAQAIRDEDLARLNEVDKLQVFHWVKKYHDATSEMINIHPENNIQQKYRRNDKNNYVELPASRMTDDDNNFSTLAKLLLALADRIFYEHLSKEGLNVDVADRRKREIAQAIRDEDLARLSEEDQLHVYHVVQTFDDAKQEMINMHPEHNFF